VSVALAFGDAASDVASRIAVLEREGFARRLWSKDATLWSADPKHQAVASNRLGWLDVASRMRAETETLRRFAAEVVRDGFTHAVLLGMGGSSLAPEVMRQTLGRAPGALALTVLDSTSPASVRAVASSHDPEHTLFLVSSKSGGTLEVVSLEAYFHDWVAAARGAGAGRAFVAITDPGTSLERLAQSRGYRHTFTNPPDIGGRYSALSYFGLVPAALIGADLDAMLDAAAREAKRCGPDARATENPALVLGAALGELARHGRDKLTLVLGPEIAALGLWIEQLIAESTGKLGRGIVPIAGEPLGPPEAYGPDRVFVAISIAPLAADTLQALDALGRAGHPVLRWSDPSLAELGAEFLGWEIATAVASAVLEVDAFDEPNVTEAKEATQAVLADFLANGRFPAPASPTSAGDVRVECPRAMGEILRGHIASAEDPTAWPAALASLAKPGDYFAILAYLHATPERDHALERLRLAARGATRLATTVGYGPRFLHSTGQLHKGGPNLGIFLQLVADEGDELPIPGAQYGFRTLIAAQSLGDYQVLERRQRRVMRVHLGANPDRVLDEIAAALRAARVQAA
jgi:glucose-6-phosphate isomerase